MIKIENVLPLTSAIQNRIDEINDIIEIVDRALTGSFDPYYASELDELSQSEFALISKAHEMKATLQVLTYQMTKVVEEWRSKKTELQDRYFTFDEAGRISPATKEAYDTVTDPNAEEEIPVVDF